MVSVGVAPPINISAFAVTKPLEVIVLLVVNTAAVIVPVEVKLVTLSLSLPDDGIKPLARLLEFL